MYIGKHCIFRDCITPSANMNTDRQIVLDAVRRDGWLLCNEYYNKWNSDRCVVLEAVKENGMALKFASDKFKEVYCIMLYIASITSLVTSLMSREASMLIMNSLSSM